MYQGRYITLSDTSNDTSDCGHVSHTCTCGCSVIYWTHNASLQVMPQVCLMIMHYSLPASPVASSPAPALAPAASPRAALLALEAAPHSRHERQRAASAAAAAAVAVATVVASSIAAAAAAGFTRLVTQRPPLLVPPALPLSPQPPLPPRSPVLLLLQLPPRRYGRRSDLKKRLVLRAQRSMGAHINISLMYHSE